MRNTKETYIKNIPLPMQALPQWCCFRLRWNEKKQKWGKQIINCQNGKWAQSDNPETWVTFEQALRYMERRKDIEGVAFALNHNGITCIDLDHSLENGQPKALAKEFIEHFSDTYTETSVSGTGIHIFIFDDVLQGDTYRNRVQTPDGEIEAYDVGRFISMTANVYGQGNQRNTVKAEDVEWVRDKLGKRAREQAVKRTLPRTHKGARELIEIIERSKRGDEFKRLFKGESQTNDHSRDDFRLLLIITFFTRGDYALSREIFMQSALYRPEKGEKYLDISIKKAIDITAGKIKEEKSSKWKKNLPKSSIGKTREDWGKQK